MNLGDEHGYGNDSGRSDRVGGSGQTRTRLPEGGGSDVYGGARRPVRTSRSLITVVGVVVLLIAAIAFANRGGGETGPVDEAKRGAGAEPTSATGVKPVAGKNGTIPSGFARDEQGAQSAAANYLVALGSDGMYDTDRRHEIVDTVYAPEVAAARQGDLDKVYADEKFLTGIGLKADGAAPDGQTFISRFSPVGSKVEKIESGTATVSVWYSALFGLAGEGSKNPVTESWYTNTFDLKWVGDDWMVTDFTQKDGPVPVGRDQAASSAEEMAGAVEQFGGFTYAR
ncbi:hypothetical protein AR457_18915 [Streptomyces agglomeratus]|uniref:hypothetical protein n=1 Tax=Streptomyces agglomeratus TaxID=285458 RepID=UPI0008547A92|nr:hypothetical protein [Streptomyces agglomeratus]OEJ39727.1 hypothetical protein BGK70_17735 [Streptomyces agglomeratus]OEJ45890.1 hypothetical protein AR457_18915 [Streptomyces agglomeratus]